MREPRRAVRQRRLGGKDGEAFGIAVYSAAPRSPSKDEEINVPVPFSCLTMVLGGTSPWVSAPCTRRRLRRWTPCRRRQAAAGTGMPMACAWNQRVQPIQTRDWQKRCGGCSNSMGWNNVHSPADSSANQTCTGTFASRTSTPRRHRPRRYSTRAPMARELTPFFVAFVFFVVPFPLAGRRGITALAVRTTPPNPRRCYSTKRK